MLRFVMIHDATCERFGAGLLRFLCMRRRLLAVMPSEEPPRRTRSAIIAGSAHASGCINAAVLAQYAE
jgi:hypothetical protein